MKKDMNKKNNFKMEQNKVDAFRERINTLIKVAGIIVLVVIIVGVANDKNGLESVREYESRDSKRLNVREDIRIDEDNNIKINEESDSNKVEEKIEARDSNKVEEKTVKRNNNQKKVSEVVYISRDKAKNIAFNNAGVEVGQCRDLEVELDYENGKRVYEVSFESEKIEYSYEIDAVGGEILRKEIDVED